MTEKPTKPTMRKAATASTMKPRETQNLDRRSMMKPSDGLGLEDGLGELGDGAWGDRRWDLVWVGKLGQWNKSAVRELAGELRDEGDEGGQRAGEKKKF